MQNKNEAGNQNHINQGTHRADIASKKIFHMLQEFSAASLVCKYDLCMGNIKRFCG